MLFYFNFFFELVELISFDYDMFLHCKKVVVERTEHTAGPS